MGVAFAGTDVIEGVGNPYSLTASAGSLLYVNTSNQQVWISNSTTKGDWSKISRSVENGSLRIPFTVLNLTPSDYPTDDFGVGSVFVASTSLKLMVCTDASTATGTWQTW